MHNFKSVIRSLIQKDERMLWNYISGMRGPDDAPDSVKCITTCVIRGDISMVNTGAVGVNYINLFGGKTSEMNEVPQHFLDHHYTALKSLSYYYREKHDVKRSELLDSAAHYFWLKDYASYYNLILDFVRMG